MIAINYVNLLAAGMVFLLSGSFLSAEEERKKGGLVLQFDDGFPSWTRIIAPELQRVGGKATGFVNNQYIHNGRISFEELKTLQNEFGWEIGSHSYHHHHAPRFVKEHGLSAWLSKELDASILELQEAGLEVRSLVFPFNAFSSELAEAVRGKVDSFRRADPLAITDGLSEDGSLPGSSIDLAQYTPVRQLKRWVDRAHRKNQILFVYGHQVLPDDDFILGTVKSVEEEELHVLENLGSPDFKDFVLLPDTKRKYRLGDTFSILEMEGTTIEVDKPGLEKVTREGAKFMAGHAYGTRVSEFKEFLEYASEKLTFYTVGEIVDGKHQNLADNPAE